MTHVLQHQAHTDAQRIIQTLNRKQYITGRIANAYDGNGTYTYIKHARHRAPSVYTGYMNA